MKRFCLLLIIMVGLSVSVGAQTSNVRICTEQEIPSAQRKIYLQVAENFLEFYYGGILFSVVDNMAQEAFIDRNMVKGSHRYKPEFILQPSGQEQYLSPVQYLQELTKQFLSENPENFVFEVSDITFDSSFRATNNIDCLVTSHYTLSLKKEDKTLFSRRCTAQCYWPQSRMYNQVALLQVEPGKDIVAYKKPMSDQGFTEGMDDKTKDLLRKAQQGDATAQNKLGDCYYYGRGVSQDYKKAVEWFNKAAGQGYAVAQYNLGYCYKKGQGVSQDYEKAVEWYSKAAEQGNADAQYSLGVCYDNGQGVPQDYKKAVEWYTKAAVQGQAQAQNNLGSRYKNGQGVPQDYKKAVEWYTKAAEQGDATAQYNLGVCYKNGQGVQQNYKKAAEWYTKAAQQGYENARKALERIKELSK